jgi:flagellar protein FlaG
MDGIANVAKQQQTQVSTPEVQGRVAQVEQTQTQSTNEVAKQATQSPENQATKINTEDDVKDLVNELNKALSPLNTNIKFGVDSHDVFYVSVIDMNTSQMIRRFPAETASSFLPKMQEVTGILFDTKG